MPGVISCESSSLLVMTAGEQRRKGAQERDLPLMSFFKLCNLNVRQLKGQWGAKLVKLCSSCVSPKVNLVELLDFGFLSKAQFSQHQAMVTSGDK